ncbi:Transposase [Marinibacterium anthonyi]|nr:Transposase [Marinibacterium anthonyi]
MSARTAVDRIGRGKERQINMRFLAMANHYVFEPDFCNPASGWEKGQVVGHTLRCDWCLGAGSKQIGVSQTLHCGNASGGRF